MSEAQHKYKEIIEKAGGIYMIARDLIRLLMNLEKFANHKQNDLKKIIQPQKKVRNTRRTNKRTQ